MKAGNGRLLRIAERVVDSEPVDWRTEMVADPVQSTRIRNLRLLERIREIHQEESVPADETPTRGLRPGERPDERPDESTFGAGEKWGSLELVEPVGRGAYGEVWRAWDESLQTHVALKLLFPRRREPEDFLREARQMAKVRHENVVAVHGAAVHGDHVGIWTDFVRGKTLEAELGERGPLGAAEAAVVAKDLLPALAAVHGAGLVHRDLKTTNVMREEGGRIVLMDFGTVVDREDLDSLALRDAFAGTAHYMAPEIFRGERGGRRSDLYSMGVVLYRLVTGKYPMDAHDLVEIRRRHGQGGAIPLRDVRPDLPAAFVRIVERAMATDRESRYASAGEMEREIGAFLSGAGASSEVAGERARGLSRSGGWRRLAFPVAVAAAAVAIWFGADRIAGGPLDVEAALYRAGTGEEARLTTGGRVQPGDQLFLEVEASRDVHVYVLNEDEQGNAHLLFPLDGMETTNPLRGGERHRLPGRRDGIERTWDVDTYGGRETLYVIASREPLADLESEIARVPAAGAAGALRLPFESLRRGIGGLGTAPGSAPRSDAPPLAGLFESLSGEAGGARGLWTWSIRLENPAP